MAKIAAAVTRWAGSSWGFGSALLAVLIWAATGPLFHWSDTWQLVINTSTTIVTFLMVFLIQRSQNKDSLAIQLKLNELVAAIEGASNRLIDIEDIDDKELAIVSTSHSVEAAETRHQRKRRHQREAHANDAGR